SSHIDRSVSVDNSEYLNIELLVKNLKNVIMKKLSMLYITESSMSLSASSAASFSAAFFSVSFSATSLQSSTLVSVSGSLTPAISVSVISTSATPALTAAFISSSSHFKKMLHRLSESCFLACTLLLFLLISRIIYYIKT
ncbi:hypothetical protein BDBG_18044, partial [Blastomyces gilchristii SLH14081]